MRSRGVVAAAVLSSALVSGGWLMQRGSVGSTRDLAASARLFDEVFERLQKDYVDPLADSTLYRQAVTGVLGELRDPHSMYLDGKRLSRLDESTSGHYGGVGIQMDVRDSGITVIAVLPGTPAERAGLAAADRLVEINGKATQGLTADEALKALRGPAGSAVRVAVDRPGLEDALTFVLVRREIAVNPVQHALLLRGTDGVGYVDLTVFSAAAAADLTRAIDSLRAAGARSLIIDLRGNPGGLLDQGVAVADLFLDRGTSIVTTKGRTASENATFDDDAPQRWATMPLIVLTDSGSASASEIVAGALQDHDRALVVGTATYGKGSAQRVFRLGNGAVKLTTALWYTPSGRSINHTHARPADEERASPSDSAPRPRFKTDAGRTVLGGGGIVPDVEVAVSAATPAQRALQAALGTKAPQFRNAVVDYALSLKGARAIVSADFAVTAAMRDELYRRLLARGVTLDRVTYDAAAPFVTQTLALTIARYRFDRRAEFERGAADDATLARAQQLLRGVTSPTALLARR